MLYDHGCTSGLVFSINLDQVLVISKSFYLAVCVYCSRVLSCGLYLKSCGLRVLDCGLCIAVSTVLSFSAKRQNARKGQFCLLVAAFGVYCG